MGVRVLILTTMIACAAPAARAQGLTFEIDGGLTFARVPDFADAVGDVGLETTVREGVTVEAGIVVPIAGRISIRPSIAFVQKGFEMSGGEMGIPAGARLRADYLEVPLLLVAEFPGSGRLSPFVVAGPTFALNTAASISSSVFGMTGEDVDLDDDVRGAELGVAIGGGLIVGRFKFEGRFTRGLTELLTADGPRSQVITKALRTNTFAAIAGIRF